MRTEKIPDFFCFLVEIRQHIFYNKSIFVSGGFIMAARRTVEQRVALIDEKIEKKKSEIEALEKQKYKLLHPVTMKTVMDKAKASGLTAEEIAEKLGIEL